MKKIVLIIATLWLFSCNTSEESTSQPTTKVLMLKVDYETLAFEGGTEFTFNGQPSGFTITSHYVTPGDFGSIKLTYQELQQTLFNGTIIWMGLGQMTFPQALLPDESFPIVDSSDVVYPTNGYHDVFNPYNLTYNYEQVWLSVQNLVQVRQYLLSNTNSVAQMFLYTPSVGVGNPADWDWIIYLKK